MDKITLGIIDKFIKSIENSQNPDELKKEAKAFIAENEPALIGLSYQKFGELLNLLKLQLNLNQVHGKPSQAALLSSYNKLLESMEWPERIEFLKMGITEMKYSKDLKHKEMAVIISLMNVGIKLLPVLLAAI